MCNWGFTIGKLKKRGVYNKCIYVYIYITDMDKTYISQLQLHVPFTALHS